MSFLLPAELQEFCDALNAKLKESVTDKTWTELSELGVFVAGLPEDCGGLGFGFQALSAILEQSGYSLLPLPLFETLALGLMPLQLCGVSPVRTKLLTEFAEKGTKLTGAMQALWETAPTADGKGKIKGTARFVPSVEGSAKVIVAAGNKLFLVDPKDSSIKLSKLETFDLRREFSTLEFNSTPGEAVGEVQIERLKQSVALLATSEMIGAALRVAEMTVEYVKTRKQFGAAIGSFQAIQHHLANVEMWVEQVQALVRYAAWAADKAPESFIEAATSAKALAGELLPRAIEVCLQVHGGIGFTHEYDLHLYLRRVQTLARLFGGTAENQQALAASFLN